MVVTGTNFGATKGTSKLTFYNGKNASTTSWSNTSITATVPSGATTGRVVVKKGAQTSNGISFAVGNEEVLYYYSDGIGSVRFSTRRARIWATGRCGRS